jgi:hypothetical protein
MCMSDHKINLGFTEEVFPAGTHMCLIYTSEEERNHVISKFIDSGLKSGEKVAYFCDETTTENSKKWLSEKGVDFSAVKKAGQFTVAKTSDVYYPTGKFVPELMLDNLSAFHNSACEQNFPASRITGEMCWATRGVPGSERLMEYESQGKVFLAKYPVTVVCQYDATRFDGATLLECLKVHPYMIVYGQIVSNPYYSSEYVPRKA